MSEIQTKSAAPDELLFSRVATILEQARGNVLRAVNSNMVIAYWLIGREIVQALQGGQERAEYGKGIIKALSTRLTVAYGKGFSAQTLWNFRLFYQTFPDRHAILSPSEKDYTHKRPRPKNSPQRVENWNWRQFFHPN